MKIKEKLIKKHGLNKPFKSWRKNKKLVVFVKNKETKRVNTIHFGDSRYKDFTEHGDKKKRRSFRARHQCSKKKNKTTPGYWACKELW